MVLIDGFVIVAKNVLFYTNCYADRVGRVRGSSTEIF
jgi:hypothetical protein